jgi:predicted porin
MKRAIFTTLFVVCAAMPMLAAELEFSANGEVEYDDNVFRTNSNKDDDVLFRLRPGFRIHEDRGNALNFSAGYEAPIEFSADYTDELNDVDHLGHGSFSYRANSRLDFFGSERYGYLRSTLRRAEADDLGLTQGFVSINDERDRVKTNAASLGTAYHFSPRTAARLVANSTFFDSTRPDRARVFSFGGVADVDYKLTLKHQLGGGLGYTYQDFGDREDIAGSTTQSYRVFGSWLWTITDTLSFDLNAGPAYLETKQEDASAFRAAPLVPAVIVDGLGAVAASIDSCGTVNGAQVSSECRYDILFNGANPSIVVQNPFGKGQHDREFTGFAEAVMSQRWSPTLATALRYSREQGDASGLGGTVIVDAVSVSNTWDFLERWQLAVRGDFVRRESAFDIAQTYEVVQDGAPQGLAGIAVRSGAAFNSTQKVDIDTNSWSVAGRITHALFKSTSIYAQVRYGQQDSQSDTLGNDSDFENFLATFGVRHVFEPIRLW